MLYSSLGPDDTKMKLDLPPALFSEMSLKFFTFSPKNLSTSLRNRHSRNIPPNSSANSLSPMKADDNISSGINNIPCSDLRPILQPYIEQTINSRTPCGSRMKLEPTLNTRQTDRLRFYTLPFCLPQITKSFVYTCSILPRLSTRSTSGQVQRSQFFYNHAPFFNTIAKHTNPTVLELLAVSSSHDRELLLRGYGCYV